MEREIPPVLKAEDKELMENILAAGKIKHKFAARLLTALNRAKGKRSNEIAAILGIHPMTASLYVKRYNSGGTISLVSDKTRKAGKAPTPEALKNKIGETARAERPADATDWSVRSLAKRFGVGRDAVNRIPRERDIKPHLVKKLSFSDDPNVAEKLADVVGLYMNPPENAMVLCVDEESRIQALERTAPLPPLSPRVPERQTVDCERRGTTALFAALDTLSGNVAGECEGHHRAKEYIGFLKKLDKNCEKGKTPRIIVDNYSTDKTKEVKEYIESVDGRFATHFIPTHSSRLNMMERWFAEITDKRIRRESWESVTQLKKAIKEFIQNWNASGRGFKWTKEPEEILANIQKAREEILMQTV